MSPTANETRLSHAMASHAPGFREPAGGGGKNRSTKRNAVGRAGGSPGGSSRWPRSPRDPVNGRRGRQIDAHHQGADGPDDTHSDVEGASTRGHGRVGESTSPRQPPSGRDAWI